MKRKRSKLITSRPGLLLNEIQLTKAHEIGVCLARCYLRGFRQIAQHYGLSCIGQDLKDAAANFDGSNAALIGFVACHCQLVEPF